MGRAQEGLDFGVHAAPGPVGGEGAEVLRGAEAARQQRRVDLGRPHVGQRTDVAADQARGLDEDVAGLPRRRLPGAVVHDVHLRSRRRAGDHFGAGAAQGQQGGAGFVDLGAVENAAAAEDDRDLRHGRAFRPGGTFTVGGIFRPPGGACQPGRLRRPAAEAGARAGLGFGPAAD